MKRIDLRILWGTLLIAAGVLYLLQNFEVIRSGVALFWAVLFGLAGASFLAFFVVNRAQWWALLPGWSLVSVSALISLDQFAPPLAQAWGGSLFLGGAGLGFWLVYLVNRANWWAIIPGGVLMTLAVVAGVEATDNGPATGGIFFLGLGLTFTAVALLPTPQGRMRWAFIPASILTTMGLLILAAAEKLLGYLWPIALIAVGVYLVYRTLRPRQS